MIRLLHVQHVPSRTTIGSITCKRTHHDYIVELHVPVAMMSLSTCTTYYLYKYRLDTGRGANQHVYCSKRENKALVFFIAHVGNHKFMSRPLSNVVLTLRLPYLAIQATFFGGTLISRCDGVCREYSGHVGWRMLNELQTFRSL